MASHGLAPDASFTLPTAYRATSFSKLGTSAHSRPRHATEAKADAEAMESPDDSPTPPKTRRAVAQLKPVVATRGGRSYIAARVADEPKIKATYGLDKVDTSPIAAAIQEQIHQLNDVEYKRYQAELAAEQTSRKFATPKHTSAFLARRHEELLASDDVHEEAVAKSTSSGDSGGGGGGGGGSGGAKEDSPPTMGESNTPNHVPLAPKGPSPDRVVKYGSFRDVGRAVHGKEATAAPTPVPSAAPPSLETNDVVSELLEILKAIGAETESLDVAEGASIFAELLSHVPTAAAPATMPGAAQTEAAASAAGGGAASTADTPPSTFRLRLNRCTAAMYTAWNKEYTIGMFHPSRGELITLAFSALYGVLYGVISQFKASGDLGPGLGGFFSAFSAISNFAQIFGTLNGLPAQIKKNFETFQGYINTALQFLLKSCLCETSITLISQITTALLGIAVAALSVLTAASLASATFAATGSTFIAHLMWAFRATLVFRATLILPDTLKEVFLHLKEKIQAVRNGDKTLIRALIETVLMGLAAYIAYQYSLSQREPMGAFAAGNLQRLFDGLGASLNLAPDVLLLGDLGLLPLIALNACYIMGGAIKLEELCAKFHPLLLVSLIFSAPTGFPGVALIGNVDLMSILVAYLSAALSNYASMAKLDYVKAKITKDQMIAKLEALFLNIAIISEQYEQIRIAAPPTENIDAINKLIRNCSIIREALTAELSALHSTPSTTFERIGEVSKHANDVVVSALCFHSSPPTSESRTPLLSRDPPCLDDIIGMRAVTLQPGS